LRSGEIRIAEDGRTHGSSCQRSVAEVNSLEISANEIRASQIRAVQISAPLVSTRQIRLQEISLYKIGHYARMRSSPSVPLFHTFEQNR
jgi:hypothetical protein